MAAVLQAIVDTDHAVANAIAAHRIPILDRVFLYITYLGNWQTITALMIVLLAVLLLLNKKRIAVLFILGLAAGGATALIIKEIFARARPLGAIIDESHLGYSFPSAHTLMSTIFYGFAAYCFFHTHANRYFRLALDAVAFLIIIAVGLSRLYLGVHWFSDVIAGWIFGAIILEGLIRGFNKAHMARPVTD